MSSPVAREPQASEKTRDPSPQIKNFRTRRGTGDRGTIISSRTNRPPGRRTRRASANASERPSTYRTAYPLTMASIEESSTGMSENDPARTSRTPALDAIARISGEGSTAMICDESGRNRCAASARTPVPLPTSTSEASDGSSSERMVRRRYQLLVPKLIRLLSRSYRRAARSYRRVTLGSAPIGVTFSALTGFTPEGPDPSMPRRPLPDSPHGGERLRPRQESPRGWPAPCATHRQGHGAGRESSGRPTCQSEA